MPRRDGSGPDGLGAVTGRGLGNCYSKKAVNIGLGVGTVIGLGRMLGRRHGSRGRGFGFSLEDEKELLKKRLDQVNSLINSKE